MMAEDSSKILCVDDEKDILESLERTLRRRFHVFTATNTQAAKEIIAENSDIAVIVSDYKIADESGVQFLTECKALLPEASRVLLSGQIEIKKLEQAINHNLIHKFVLKPWENDQLLLHVVEAVKNHKNILERERLKALSITDPVTQLTNHRFFQEKVRIEWEKYKQKSNPLSLVMIDIDHFKKFNDRFGHPEGDQFLSHVAEVLAQQSPTHGSLSRYGGEEFALILPNTNSLQALSHAEKLRTSILDHNFNNYPLSISLGVATAPEHANSVDELIISADQSLYQAKRRGRNQTVVGLG